ncbi:MAG: patatin-like phospholipase family protein [Bacteroidetes bacterium]|nr:patatin-like phospholipase family protein [Bacteroidota bacterium]
MPEKTKYKIGLVLSGGGARGFAHIGAIQALNEAGIYPDIISGVSIGAIIGSLYADGNSPGDMMKMFNKINLNSYFKFIMPNKGFLKMTGLADIISKNLHSKTFEELKIPLFVAATDLNNGKCDFFNSGELYNTVIASSTIPALFQPIVINGKTYVDGGVLNNFPVEPLEKICDILIGISINPTCFQEDFQSLYSVIERSFQLSFASHLNKSKKKCNIFIEPQELEKYRMFDIKKSKEIYNLGYKEAKKVLAENKEEVSNMLK